MAYNSLVHFLRYTHTMVQDRRPSRVSQLRTPSCTHVRSTVRHRGRFHLLRQVQQGDADVACNADALQSQRRHCHRCATCCDSAACQSRAAVDGEAEAVEVRADMEDDDNQRQDEAAPTVSPTMPFEPVHVQPMRYETQPSNHDRAWWAAPCVTDWQSAPSTWQHCQSASSSFGHDKVIFTLLNRERQLNTDGVILYRLVEIPWSELTPNATDHAPAPSRAVADPAQLTHAAVAAPVTEPLVTPAEMMNKAPTATLKEAYEKCAAPPFQKDGVSRSEYPMKLNDTSLTLQIFKEYLKSRLNHSDAQVCFWHRSPARKFGHAHAH